MSLWGCVGLWVFTCGQVSVSLDRCLCTCEVCVHMLGLCKFPGEPQLCIISCFGAWLDFIIQPHLSM